MPTLDEQETTLVWSRADQLVTAWTASEIERRRWEGMGLELQPLGTGWRTHFPVRWLRIRKPRELSSEDRQRLLERFGTPAVTSLKSDLAVNHDG